ncbi:integrase [Xanthomonas citri pv. malvacearum]|uniref:integrase n=1 Tax=Xanthomonas citri TaxID=346 RepID=UPI0022AF6519|nr:integrase [Xanthomonas citri]WAW88962.1 integrase [Xanthomonas citri pv. malvacearum]WAW93109.1 integrase [Xanthomonas citri pv. malvacearum]
MSNSIELIADRLPRVTVEDVRRFAAIVDIRDAGAFAVELQAFVHERVEAVELPVRLEMETMEQTLARKATALRAETRWAPNETEVQRGRTALLKTFNQPHNLPIPEFAKLADKSRQQIYKDILARRLLALNVGPRGQKLPDWQLDPVKQQLTQAVLQEVEGIDNWTIYGALSEPLEGLGGRSPVDAVTPDSIDKVSEAVFNVLGVQVH